MRLVPEERVRSETSEVLRSFKWESSPPCSIPKSFPGCCTGSGAQREHTCRSLGGSHRTAAAADHAAQAVGKSFHIQDLMLGPEELNVR